MSVVAKDIIQAKLRGKFGGPLAGTSTHKIEVTVAGKRDLARLADAIERAGRPALAATIRKSTEFKCTVSPAQWEALRTQV